MNFTVRVATEDDAASMAAVLNRIIEAGDHTILDQPFSVAEQAQFIRDFPAKGVFHVAVDADDQVLGLQDVQPLSPATRALDHVGEIATFVALDAHRCGIGRALAQRTFAVARQRGYRKIMATIRGDNPTALAFYQSQGFTIVGTAREHARVGDRFIDEVITERLLD